MPFIEGNFSASALGDVIIEESNLLGDVKKMKELNQSIVAGAAILGNQNHMITPIYSGDGKRCIQAKIVTMRGGNLMTTDTAATCDVVAGNKGGTEGKTINKELLVPFARFSVYDDQCNNDLNEYNKKYAYLSLLAKVQLELALTKKLIGLAAANADTPQATWFETPGTVNVDTFEIPTANFNSNLIADIVAAGTFEEMSNPILINGRNFYNDKIMAEFESQGCCSTNAALMTDKYFQFYWDLLNVDQTLGGKYSLLIDNNALYFWSSPNYDSTMPMLRNGDVYTWKEPLPRLTYGANNTSNQIWVDIKAKKVCTVVDGIDTYGMNFEFALRGSIGTALPDYKERKSILKIKQV